MGGIVMGILGLKLVDKKGLGWEFSWNKNIGRGGLCIRGIVCFFILLGV